MVISLREEGFSKDPGGKSWYSLEPLSPVGNDKFFFSIIPKRALLRNYQPWEKNNHYHVVGKTPMYEIYWRNILQSKSIIIKKEMMERVSSLRDPWAMGHGTIGHDPCMAMTLNHFPDNSRNYL